MAFKKTDDLTKLSAAADVNLNNVAALDALRYEAATGKWQNAALTLDTVADGTTNKAFTATEKTKLAGIAPAATVNDTDANLRNRANHTGAQAISTITGLQTVLDAKAPLASPVFTGTVTVPAPVNPTDPTTKTYVDQALAQKADSADVGTMVPVLGASDSVPLGTPAGSVIVRRS